MSQTVSPSTSRCYGLARVSRAMERFARRRSSLSQGRAPSPAIARRRPGPIGPCPDADLQPIISAGKSKRPTFTGEGYRNSWARLRVAGVRSSPRRVRRVMGENRLRASHRVGRNAREDAATEPSSPTRSMENVGNGHEPDRHHRGRAGLCSQRKSPSNTRTQKSSTFTPPRSANRFEALEPVRQGVYRCFGSIAPGVAPWTQAASRSWLQLHVRRFPRRRDQMSGHRSFAILRARTRRAMASPSASSEP